MSKDKEHVCFIVKHKQKITEASCGNEEVCVLKIKTNIKKYE